MPPRRESAKQNRWANVLTAGFGGAGKKNKKKSMRSPRKWRGVSMAKARQSAGTRHSTKEKQFPDWRHFGSCHSSNLAPLSNKMPPARSNSQDRTDAGALELTLCTDALEIRLLRRFDSAVSFPILSFSLFPAPTYQNKQHPAPYPRPFFHRSKSFKT